MDNNWTEERKKRKTGKRGDETRKDKSKKTEGGRMRGDRRRKQGSNNRDCPLLLQQAPSYCGRAFRMAFTSSATVVNANSN